MQKGNLMVSSKNVFQGGGSTLKPESSVPSPQSCKPIHHKDICRSVVLPLVITPECGAKKLRARDLGVQLRFCLGGEGHLSRKKESRAKSYRHMWPEGEEHQPGRSLS